MALREILKNDTSAEIQAALSASHDAEIASNISITDESNNDNSEDVNIEKNNVQEKPTEFCDMSVDIEKMTQ